VVLLDTTVPLAQDVTCNVGYAGAEFTATAGRLVTISVSGSVNLTPLFILYAPAFATQLGVSSPAGPGAASFAFIPAQTGLHHLSICDVNGVAGTLKVGVNQR
jgi:hypothetical protein